MKKKLLLFLMALVWWPMLMQAFTFMEDGIKYEISYNSESGRYEATVSGYEGEPTDVVIPATVMDKDVEYMVTSIKSSAFSSCSSLTLVVIPEGMASIGELAFNDCTSLASVVIPEGVASIGLAAFQGCTSLTSVVLPEGLTSIGGDAFSDCTSLTSVVIPEGVGSIGEYAFYMCS